MGCLCKNSGCQSSTSVGKSKRQEGTPVFRYRDAEAECLCLKERVPADVRCALAQEVAAILAELALALEQPEPVLLLQMHHHIPVGWHRGLPRLDRNKPGGLLVHQLALDEDGLDPGHGEPGLVDTTGAEPALSEALGFSALCGEEVALLEEDEPELVQVLE